MKRKFSLIAACWIVLGSLLQSKPPDGFVEQTLEPTGGKINKPRGWFYTEAHAQENGGTRLMWTLAKEDPRKGYDTGFRIQYFMGVKKATGKMSKQFVLEFIESKRKEAREIPRDCAPQVDGFFTRVCLETEEGPYPILYSLFWDNVGDDAMVTIAGTKKEEWSKYTQVFDQMRRVTLLDLNYMERKAAVEKSQKRKNTQR